MEIISMFITGGKVVRLIGKFDMQDTIGICDQLMMEMLIERHLSTSKKEAT